MGRTKKIGGRGKNAQAGRGDKFTSIKGMSRTASQKIAEVIAGSSEDKANSVLTGKGKASSATSPIHLPSSIKAAKPAAEGTGTTTPTRLPCRKTCAQFLLPPAVPRLFLIEVPASVVIYNVLFMMGFQRVAGEKRGVFELLASQDYGFIFFIITAVVLLHWVCRAKLNDTNDKKVGIPAQFNKSLSIEPGKGVNPLFIARQNKDIKSAKSHIHRAEQLLHLLVQHVHKLELKARSKEDISSVRKGVDTSLGEFQSQLLARLNTIVQAANESNDSNSPSGTHVVQTAASAAALEAAKEQANELQVKLARVETMREQMASQLQILKQQLVTSESRRAKDIEIAKEEAKSTLERMHQSAQLHLKGLREEASAREQKLSDELAEARAQYNAARQQELASSKQQQEMAAEIEKKKASLRETENHHALEKQALEKKLKDASDRAAQTEKEIHQKAQSDIERLREQNEEVQAKFEEQRRRAEIAEVSLRDAQDKATREQHERTQAELEATQAKEQAKAAKVAELEAIARAEAIAAEKRASEKRAKEELEAATKKAKEEADVRIKEAQAKEEKTRIAAENAAAIKEKQKTIDDEAHSSPAKFTQISHIEDLKMSSGVTPELASKLKKARRRSLEPREFERRAVADLKKAISECKKTKLYQHFIVNNADANTAAEIENTTVKMSGNLGIMMLVEDCEVAVDELMKAIDVASTSMVVSEGGFKYEQEGNKLLNEGNDLHSKLGAIIEKAQAAATSEEAKAEAKAAAAARGMPECLQWTLQRRKLVRKLVQDIPDVLTYTPAERQAMHDADLSLRWVFVPDENQCYLPAKVLGEIDNSGSSSGWSRKKGRKLLDCVACNGTRINVDVTDPGGSSSIIHELEHPKMLALVPDDLADSFGLNEATLLHYLRVRFSHDRFYTSLGNILISINPFKWDQRLYSKKVIQFYVDNRQLGMRKRNVPPHTFAIAERAFLALAQSEAKDQVIIVSGESGAGKTEVAKQCLAYLAAVSMAAIKTNESKSGASSIEEKQARLKKSRKMKSTRSLLMMGYAPGVSSKLVDKIVLANPILEAFGNAKTLRNSNSSRFGKWLIVHYDARHSILGCANQVYLLEKSRVVYQSEGERNFHIFYSLLLGADEDTKERISLDNDTLTSLGYSDECGSGGCGAFHYTNQSGVFQLPNNHDEKAHFEELVAALQALEFSDETIEDIFSCIAAVLYLGNTSFVSTDAGAQGGASKDSCRVTDESQQWLDKAAELLSVTSRGASGLGTWMCRHKMPTKGRGPASLTMIGHKPEKAVEVRDATVKSIYDRLFKWIVARVNISAGPKDVSSSRNFIGLLDIFGFEVFEKNGFDQLCINYANEKLQKLFNESTFQGEMTVYESEGVGNIADLILPDNSDVINVIGGKKGTSIFRLLDDENKRREAGSNEAFFAKILREHGNNSSIKRPRKGQSLPIVSGDDRKKTFLIRHFAGNVSYSPDGFLQTNADTLNDEIQEVLASSDNNSVLKELFTTESERSGSQNHDNSIGPKEEHSLLSSKSHQTAKKKKEKTVSAQFRSDIDSLVRQIGPDKKTGIWKTDPHYVRCIKSNSEQKASIFEDEFILKQLRCAGIPEASSILRAGYPFRLKHKDFREENAKLAPPNFKHSDDDKAWCSNFIDYFTTIVPEFEGTVAGKTMVLSGSKQNFHLNAYRNMLDEAAVKVQSNVRGYLTRKNDSEPQPEGKKSDFLRKSRDLPRPLSALQRTMSKVKMQRKVSSSPHRKTIRDSEVQSELRF